MKRKHLFALLLFCMLVFLIILTLKISNDRLATIISGFWSAVATACLGAIALWQNQQYKKLSEKSFSETEATQKEIRNLNKQTTDAIYTLKKIEMAKYYPQIMYKYETFFGITSKSIEREYSGAEYVFVPVAMDIPFYEAGESLKPLVDKYYSISFFAKNIGEKSIRNFRCTCLTISKNRCNCLFSETCDIHPGQTLIITIINFPHHRNKKDVWIEMNFLMSSIIMDEYHSSLSANVNFQRNQEKYTNVDFCEISSAELVLDNPTPGDGPEILQ